MGEEYCYWWIVRRILETGCGGHAVIYRLWLSGSVQDAARVTFLCGTVISNRGTEGWIEIYAMDFIVEGIWP